MKQGFLFTIVLISLYLCIGLDLKAEALDVHVIAKGLRPNMVADSTGHLHAVFIGEKKNDGYDGYMKDSKPDIYYSQSNNDGTAWTVPVKIPRSLGISHSMFLPDPDIATEASGAIDIVWSDTALAQIKGDIFFTRSTDSGKTWIEPINISKTTGASLRPVIAIGTNSSIHVVWEDTTKGPKNSDIYYSYSNDGGKTWGKNPLLPAENISNTPGYAACPKIAIDTKGIVHVTWLDDVPGQTYSDTYYARKLDGIWSSPTNISHSSNLSYHPGIACGSKEKVYLVWSDTDSFYEKSKANIWCAIAEKAGPFSKPFNISNTAGFYSQPVIAADQADRVAVVWSSTHSRINKPGVYSRFSTDTGNKFSDLMDLSNTSTVNNNPNVIIANNKMIVISEEICQGKDYGYTTSVQITSLPFSDIKADNSLLKQDAIIEVTAPFSSNQADASKSPGANQNSLHPVTHPKNNEPCYLDEMVGYKLQFFKSVHFPAGSTIAYIGHGEPMEIEPNSEDRMPYLKIKLVEPAGASGRTIYNKTVWTITCVPHNHNLFQVDDPTIEYIELYNRPQEAWTAPWTLIMAGGNAIEVQDPNGKSFSSGLISFATSSNIKVIPATCGLSLGDVCLDNFSKELVTEINKERALVNKFQGWSDNKYAMRKYPYPNWYFWRSGVAQLMYEVWKLIRSKPVPGEVITLGRDYIVNSPCCLDNMHWQKGDTIYDETPSRDWPEGSIKLAVTINSGGKVKAEIVQSEFPEAINKVLVNSINKLTTHPAVIFPPVFPAKLSKQEYKLAFDKQRLYMGVPELPNFESVTFTCTFENKEPKK